MVAGASLLGSGRAFAQYAASDVAPPDLPIEDGASLRVLRPSKFVQGDETLFLENTKKFTEQTGVDVRVDSESWEDLRPKTAVAANVGSGPDIVLAWSDDPHQFEGNTLELSDIAEYLGKKYGGWYPLAERYGHAARAARGSRCRSAPRAAASCIASPGSTRPATTASRAIWTGFSISAASCSRTATRPGSRSATRSATPTPGAIGWCGPTAATWPTRRTTSSSTARRRSRRSNTPRRSTRPSSRARCPGSIPRTTRRSSPARSG